MLLLAVYTYTVWLMLQITAQYVPVRWDVAFLAIKQDFIHLPHFRLAFYVHVFSAMFVLIAGYTQFSQTRGTLHRRMGWLYVAVTVLLAGPSGLVLGIYANGGVSSQAGFCLLAVLWEAFTIIAVMRARQRNFRSHREWMIRSFALALSAITLRSWKFVLVFLFEPRPMDVYRVVAWLGWVLNLVLAELWIRRGRTQR